MFVKGFVFKNIFIFIFFQSVKVSKDTIDFGLDEFTLFNTKAVENNMLNMISS